MIRALIFLVLVTLVALAAVTFVAEPGNVRIEGWDWRVDTSVGVLVLAVAILAAAAAAVYRFWRTLREAPRALAVAGRSRRQSRGSRALA
ncbi:MAG: heme biosynthesis HemY N-terminal domain-containing protein, partial [Kiloniellales bacterium]